MTHRRAAGQGSAPPPASTHERVPRPASVGGTLSSLGTPFPRAFFDRDPRLVARDLLGAVLACESDEGLTAGVVVETEAYLGDDDPACHAVYGRTARTWHLFGPAGTAYVYRIYGMHWCVNAVTLDEGIGSAVLLRALAPIVGVELMQQRRPRARADRELTNGPGKLCAALGIDGRLDGAPLDRPPLLLGARRAVSDADVVVTPRIGITRGAALPYRYFVRDDPYVSPTPRAFPRAAYERTSRDHFSNAVDRL